MLSTFRFSMKSAPALLGLFLLLAIDGTWAQSNADRPERQGRNRRQPHKTAAADTLPAPSRYPSLTLFETEIDLDSLTRAITADTLPTAPDTVMPLGEILRRISYDKALDSLFQTRLAYYKQHPTQGYSVLFFSASGNHSGAAAEQADEFFQFLYPDTPTYLSYDAPYYKLKAGNFRTRLEASAFLAQIQNDYPNAFVVRDILDIKHLLHMEDPEPEPEPVPGPDGTAVEDGLDSETAPIAPDEAADID